MYHLPFVIFHLREIVASRRLAVVLDRQRDKAKIKNDKCQMIYMTNAVFVLERVKPPFLT
jgi:hypothetical protein